MALSVSEANEMWKKTMPRIIARAWSDSAFLERFKRDPQSVAREYNLPLLENTVYEVVHTNQLHPNKVVLYVPPRPRELPNETTEELSRYAEEQGGFESSCV